MRAAALALGLLVATTSAAFTPPALRDRVTDVAGKLSPPIRQGVEERLRLFEEQTSIQLAVLLVPSLEGSDIEDAAYETFRAWKLGRAGADNGVLLMVAVEDRKVRIETGKGIGGELTDLESNLLLRKEVSPFLKAGQFDVAIDRGTAALIRKLSPSAGAPAEDSPQRGGEIPIGNGGGGGEGLLIGLFGLFFLFLFFVSRRRRGRGGGPFFFWGGGGGWGGGGFGGGGGDDGFSGGGGESGGGGSSDSY